MSATASAWPLSPVLHWYALDHSPRFVRQRATWRPPYGEPLAIHTARSLVVHAEFDLSPYSAPLRAGCLLGLRQPRSLSSGLGSPPAAEPLCVPEAGIDAGGQPASRSCSAADAAITYPNAVGPRRTLSSGPGATPANGKRRSGIEPLSGHQRPCRPSRP